MTACARCGCTDENPCIVHPTQGRMGKLFDLAMDSKGKLDHVALEGLAISGVERCWWASAHLCSACNDDARNELNKPPLLLDAYGRPWAR